MTETISGTYEHYSGKKYVVLGIARHSETLDEFVVYQGQYDDPEFGKKPIWIRPKKEFHEQVIKDGKKVPRFRKI